MNSFHKTLFIWCSSRFPKIVCIALILLIGFTIWQIVEQIMSDKLSGPSDAVKSKNSFPSSVSEKICIDCLKDYHLFGEQMVARPSPKQVVISKPKDIDLKLLGVFIIENKNRAVINVNNTQKVYKVGDMITNNISVYEILPNCVRAERDGKQFWLRLNEKGMTCGKLETNNEYVVKTKKNV